MRAAEAAHANDCGRCDWLHLFQISRGYGAKQGFVRSAERFGGLRRWGCAVHRPSGHQSLALVEEIGTQVGGFDLVLDLVRKAGLTDLIANTRDLGAPILEAASKAMRSGSVS